MMDASSGHGVAPATATTSADIFAPESDEDLSCLDSLDLWARKRIISIHVYQIDNQFLCENQTKSSISK